jgi:hypothetical protein
MMLPTLLTISALGGLPLVEIHAGKVILRLPNEAPMAVPTLKPLPLPAMLPPDFQTPLPERPPLPQLPAFNAPVFLERAVVDSESTEVSEVNGAVVLNHRRNGLCFKLKGTRRDGACDWTSIEVKDNGVATTYATLKDLKRDHLETLEPVLANMK